MAVLDAFVVNVAAPSIHASLHIFGCGLATSTGLLVTLRFVQGAGVAVMILQVLSLIQRTFDGPARGRPMRLYAAVLAGGAVTGQVVGGVLVSANLFGGTWRPVFLLNVPIGVILFLAGLRFLPGGQGRPGRTLDLAGVATLTPAVLALILPLVLGQSEHWPVWGWACLAGSAVLFGAFVVVERHVAARGGAPLIPERLLRLPGTAPGVAALFCVMAVFGGFFFVLALHLQGGLADSPVRAGLIFAPAGLGFAVVSLNWQRLPGNRPAAVSFAGFVAYGAGLLLLAGVIGGGGHGGAWLPLALTLVGAGMAAAFSPLMTAVVMRVPVADAADATGVIVTVNQLALVVGVATFGTLYLNLAGHLPQDAAGGFRMVSAHAVAVTSVVLAAGAVAGGILATLRTRTAR